MSEWEQLELSSRERLLIYGIGNLGRQDDGLGIRLIQKLEAIRLPEFVSLEANYQLNVEDALLISDFDVVLFVDASVEAQVENKRWLPVSIRPVQPCSEVSFSTHAMSFGGIRYLCESLYHRKPRAFLLALNGYAWEVNEELSEKAQNNLENAFQYLCSRLGILECTKSP